MTSLSRLWEAINDFIALHGSKGCPLSKAFDAVGLHNDALRERFTKKLRDQGKHTITDIRISEKCSSTKEQANVPKTYGSSLQCIAKSHADFWKAIGIETSLNIPDSQVLTSLLELLGIARGHGMLTTEACQMLGVSQLYTVVERGIALGVIVKRTLIPGPVFGPSVPASNRVKSRTVILHLRRFATEYNPIDDRACFEADDQMKEDVCRYIKNFMRTFMRTSVFFTDIDNAIGCCPRTLRSAFADELQKRDTGIRLYGLTIREDTVGTSLYSDNHRGRISFALVGDDATAQSVSVQQDSDECIPEVIANAALYEQASARIRWNGSKGVLSHHIRSIHCLPPKRNDRLINDLRIMYNYSVNKQQCGKQAAYRIYPPLGDKATTTNASDDQESNGMDGRTEVPKDKKKPAAGGMTELKSDRLRFILDLLRKEGGARSVQQISFSLRQDEAVRGVGFTAARRTVAKCIQQLQIDGKVTQVSVPPSGSNEKQSSENDVPSRKKEGPDIFKRGDTIQLVLLNDAGTAEELIAAFLQRQSKEEDQRQQNLIEKTKEMTKVKVKSSQSAITSNSKKKKPRKRKQESSSDSSDSSSTASSSSSEDGNILPSTGGAAEGLLRERRFRIAARDAVAARARSKLPAAPLAAAATANNSSLSSDADDSDSGSDELFVLASANRTARGGAAKGLVSSQAATVVSGTAKRKSRVRIKPPAASSSPSDECGIISPSSPLDGEDSRVLSAAPLGLEESLAASNESKRSTHANTTGSMQKRKLPVELAFAQLLDSFEAVRASGADSGVRPHLEDAVELPGEDQSVVVGSSSNSTSARKRKGVDIPLEEQQLPKKVGRYSAVISSVTTSIFVGSASIFPSAPPLGLTVPEALAHARSTDVESTKDDAVTPQEAFLLCHMFSLDETFDCVQPTTILCDELTPVDGEENLPTDVYEEKSSRLSEEDTAAKDMNTGRQAVRCTVRFPVADVISAAAAEATCKAMGPCHSGHYGPNLNRVLCGMNSTTPVNEISGSSRCRHNHNGFAENSADWLLTQVLEAGMSGVTMMELIQRKDESSNSQALIDVAQNLVGDGLISIAAHTPIDQGYQQVHNQSSNVTVNFATTRLLDPVYAALSHKIALSVGDEDDAGIGGSRGKPVGKKLQHHQLRCKVVLLLTQKPGCYLEQIHATACTQLTLDQVIMLLGDMENDGLLYSRKCSISVGITSPFECFDTTTTRRNPGSTGNVAFFLRF